MAERTQGQVERTERRRDRDADSPPAANPKTIERGKQLSEELDKTLKEIDELLAEEAERRGYGTGEAASIAAAETFVASYVQRGGE